MDTGRMVLDAREPDTGACSVFWWEQAREGDLEWDDRGGFVDMYLSTSQTLSEGYTRTEVDLPSGAVTRIDDRVPELDRRRTDFLLSDGEGYYALTCQSDGVPAYDPLAVAETFEFLDGGVDTLPG
jgi:hypothetical protein